MSEDAAAQKQTAKTKIRELHRSIGESVEAKEGAKTKRLRREVKFLKRATRRLAKEIKASKATEPAAAAS